MPYDADGSERGRGVRPYQLQLTRVIVSVMTLFNVAAGLIYQAEHVVNPDISNYFSALYFAVCTLTTVGFGDITPITPAGRAVVCCSILAGVLVVPAQAADLVDALLKQRRRGGGLGTKTSSRSDSLPLTNSYDDSDSSDDEEGGDGYAIAAANIKDTEHIQKSQHLVRTSRRSVVIAVLFPAAIIRSKKTTCLIPSRATGQKRRMRRLFPPKPRL